MTALEILRFLQKEIHTTVVATVDAEGLPVTCTIDMMDYDNNGLYFLTAKGKNFYERLKQSGVLALTVFQIYEATGEWFDLSKKPIERYSFAIGKAQEQKGYFVTDRCTGCGCCRTVCPQNCIRFTNGMAVIRQENCLHCGNCYCVCPVQAIGKR